MGTINQTTQTKPPSNINQTKFTDAQKKDYTTINNTRTGVDDEPSDTSTKGILTQAGKLGLKGDARRAYVAEQIAKNANANKSVIQKQNELVDKRADIAEENMVSDTERINKDEETLLATKAKNKEIADKYFSDIEAQEQSYFAEYEAEQNRLLAEGEGTQLNQVRSQIYQALAARGIDISRIPPEQLIALSGEIGTRAFSNIFQMKEGVKNRILERSRDKLNRLNELKSKRTINDSEYNEAVQSIQSAADLQRSDIDKQFKDLIFGTTGTEQQKIQLQETNTAGNAALATTLAGTLGLSPSEVGIISQFVDPKKSPAENQLAITKSLENPASPISKAMAEAKRIANEQAVRDKEIENLPKMKQLELQRYEIDLKNQVDNRKITSDEAIAKLRSATDTAVAEYNAQNRKSSGTGETNIMTD